LTTKSIMNFKRAIKDWVKYITPQIIIIICLISLNQCKSDSLDEIAPQRPPYIYEIPESVDGGWETAHLDNVAMKMQPIQALFENHLARRFKKQHSVLIVKDGKLVVEEYFKGYDLYSQYTQFNLNRKHYMASVSKSIISALIGISIDHSLINDTDEKLSVFFPDHYDQFIGGKEQISIEDALTMQTGIRWDHPDQAHIMMSQSSYVDYVLDQPMDSIPGKKFQYSDGVTVLLGAVVAHVSGIPADEYAEDFLFEPIGIMDSHWISTSSSGELGAGWGLFLKPRDMARFGQLYLNKGIHEGKQIISSEWVEQSTQNKVEEIGYAYHWWCYDFNIDGQLIKTFAASGNGGQMIFVVNELNMVVVFTAGHWNTTGSNPWYQMRNYILPSAL